jgi:hypothetical protein
MRFKLSSATSYQWKVAGRLANKSYSFTAEFAFLDQERIDYLLVASAKRAALLKRGEDDPDLEGVNHRTIAAEVLVGWSGVIDDDGEPVDFTAESADKFLRIQGVAKATCDAWCESLEGAKRGNSKAPRGIG